MMIAMKSISIITMAIKNYEIKIIAQHNDII